MGQFVENTVSDSSEMLPMGIKDAYIETVWVQALWIHILRKKRLYDLKDCFQININIFA
jgi:hypothetical protein